MNEYKKYTWRMLAALLAFLAINAVIWECCTKVILSGRYRGGDLARLGYLPDSKLIRSAEVNLPVRHLEEKDYHGQPVRVMTLGDSFSNGGGEGANKFYQDYIASYNRCTVLNIEPYRGLDPFSMAIVYLNNGFLDRVRPKYLIINLTEKSCISGFANKMNFNRNISLEELGRLEHMGFVSNAKPKTSFINLGNFKFVMNGLLYRFSDNAVFSKTYVRELDRPLFSVNNGRKLLFYRDDIRRIPLATPKAVAAFNENLNQLADRLREKGVQLYFMPSVDKYNLYSRYIVDNPYPPSIFFESLRKLPKRYVLIDTKKLLLEELERGEKDVFYPDDTHWSWKASRKIFSETRFE